MKLPKVRPRVNRFVFSEVMTKSPKEILDVLQRHSLSTLAIVTTAAALFEIWWYQPWRRVLIDWFKDSAHIQTLVLYFGLFWLAVFLGILVWQLLSWSLSPSDYKDRKDLLQLTTQMLGGALIIFGVYVTWQQLQLTQDNFKLAQDGQVADRYSKAVDQIGKQAQRETRLGGIYELEHIAEKYPKEYAASVIDVLTAYVRMNAPWPEPPEKDRGAAEKQVGQPRNISKTTEPQSGNTSPAADIFAILAFLSKEKSSSQSYWGSDRRRIDLSDTNLGAIKLRKSHFEYINYDYIHTQNADFSEASLDGATFQNSWLLASTIFSGAHLNRAFFTGAHMEHAVLRGAELKEAEFTSADLSWAQFDNAKPMDGANFNLATLKCTSFLGVDLSKVKPGSLTQAQIDLAIIDEKPSWLPKGIIPPPRSNSDNCMNNRRLEKEQPPQKIIKP